MNKSTEALIWAMNARGLSQAAWRVLVSGLAKRVGKRGFDVWPKHRTLAEDCEMGVSTVRRALQELEAGGYVQIIARFDNEGDRTSNIYRLQVRAKMTYPTGDVDIHPDDEDDDNSIPSRSEGGLSKLNTPPLESGRRVRSNRADGLFTGGQAELDSEEHIPGEDSPPSPDGEGTPTGNLFGDADLPEIRPQPLDEFVTERWHQLKADHPGIADIDVLSDARVKKIQARAAEVVRGRKRKGVDSTPEGVWEEIFERIRASLFLCGRAPPGKGRTSPFKLTLDYVLRQSEFGRILEGGYDDGPNANRGFDARSGREYGPAEQATRGAVASLYAARAR